MALKTEKTEAAATKEAPKAAVAKEPAVKEEPTVVLELALYTNYTWNGFTYKKGEAYRFRQTDAMALLSEQDHNRPIWKQYTPPKKRKAAQQEIVDSTRVSAAPRGPAEEPNKRIDVGDDSELGDILGADAETGGENVTI